MQHWGEMITELTFGSKIPRKKFQDCNLKSCCTCGLGRTYGFPALQIRQSCALWCWGMKGLILKSFAHTNTCTNPCDSTDMSKVLSENPSFGCLALLLNFKGRWGDARRLKIWTKSGNGKSRAFCGTSLTLWEWVAGQLFMGIWSWADSQTSLLPEHYIMLNFSSWGILPADPTLPQRVKFRPDLHRELVWAPHRNIAISGGGLQGSCKGTLRYEL